MIAPRDPARLLDGFWRRAGLAVDGGTRGEAEHAYWAQAGDLFVDVRVGHDGSAATAFGGTTAVREGTIRDGTIVWTHEIEAVATGMAEDTATFTLDGDTLVEQGSIDLDGETIAYTEWWERIDNPLESFRAVADGREGIAVVGADLAVIIALGPDVAAGWVLARRGATWLVEHRAGAPPQDPIPDAGRIDGPQGWSWRAVAR